MCALLTLPLNVAAQKYVGSPVTKPRLIGVLRSKSLQTREIVKILNESGADFQMTDSVESELVSAGARPEVLAAVRNNYRSASKPTNSNRPSNNTANNTALTKAGLLKILKAKSMSNGAILDNIEQNGVAFQTTAADERELAAAGASPAIIAAVKSSYRGAAKTTTGAPLSKDAIVALLQNGISDAQVQQNVKNRGVSFKMNPSATQEIRSAGGSSSLVNLINIAYVSGDDGNNSGSNFGNNSASSGGSDYDDYISQAIETYNNDVVANAGVGSSGRLRAIQTLQKAAQLNPNNPSAYQQLGFMTLYGTANGFSAAEGFMRKAIDLGGSAVLRVHHDHDGIFKETCTGSLYIAKDAVRFESDNNVHTFETMDANIQKVSMNNSFKQLFQTKVGSFKIVLKSEDKSGTKFSFAPLTNDAQESKMVIRLIGK
jgi:hypothetical protein